MQTFLPYADFQKSVECLDYRRLGKQRVECKQILIALAKRKNNIKGGWVNHPAVVQWEGYEEALKEYYNHVVSEWIKRGYKNSMPLLEVSNEIRYPEWIGKEEYHSSHRSNLLRKKIDFYSKYGWQEEPNKPYYWGIKKES